MVVLGLYNYLLPNIGELISLEELAFKYKNEFRETPVIVVDGIRILDPCFKELGGGIYGGQWSEYLQRIRNFVQKINSVDIKFVFFFDGSFKEFSEDEIELRQKFQTSKITSIFQSIRDGNFYAGDYKCLPPGIPSIMRYILKYEFGCDVRTSMTNMMQEIARFAAETDNCIGILANDADYIIFETKPLLFARELDTENLTTYMFQRSKFIEESGLDGLQLPLLACLAGNRFISGNDLKSFHSTLTRIKPIWKDAYLIYKVMDSIKHNSWTGNQEELSEIAEIAQINIEKLKEVMSYYQLATLNATENKFSFLRKECADSSIPTPLYTLLLIRKYKEGSSMEDPYDNQLPPSALIYRPLRQRLYYILFGGQLVKIKEHCVYKENNIAGAEPVQSLPIEIGETIPPIFHLLFEDVDQELRWKLFASCMGLTIPISCLKTIEPRLVAMCSLLNFLIQNEEIGLEDWEVKSFIYQAIYPKTIDISQLKIGDISSRPVSLSGILFRGVTTIIKVIPVCGYPIKFEDAMPWKYLEGEVFHYAYNLLKDHSDNDEIIMELCENNKEISRKLLELYELTVMGTRLDVGED